MKKMLSIVLALMLMFSATACSDGGQTEESKASSVSAAAPASEPEPTVVTLPETVMYDEGGIKITATGLDEDSVFGPQVKLTIENDSSAGVLVQTGYCVVNGWAVGCSLSQEVSAGKKADAEMTLSRTDLENAHVETLAQIECTLRMIDPESFVNSTETGWITLATDAAEPAAYQPEGTELFTESGIRITALEQTDSLMGKGIRLYIENSTEADYTFTASEVSVDGYMVNGNLYADIPAGRKAITELILLDDEENSERIENMTSLEFCVDRLNLNDLTDHETVGPFTVAF